MTKSNQKIYLLYRYTNNKDNPPILMMVCPTKAEADRQADIIAISDPKDYDNDHEHWSNEWDKMPSCSSELEQYKMNILVFEEVMNRPIEY